MIVGVFGIVFYTFLEIFYLWLQVAIEIGRESLLGLLGIS